MNSICETTYVWEMIAILGNGFISWLISSNNQNPQLAFRKHILYWGFYETCDRKATTTQGCHLVYTDTLTWEVLLFVSNTSLPPTPS